MSEEEFNNRTAVLYKNIDQTTEDMENWDLNYHYAYYRMDLRKYSEKTEITEKDGQKYIGLKVHMPEELEKFSKISQNRKVNKDRKTTVDPEYKIYKRFKNFTDKLITEYTTLYTIYGEALNIVNETLGIDEAQDIIIMFYLQDISVQFLEEEHDNPIAALNKLVTYFEEKLSTNGKKYDRSAIKFYLVNEMIKCRVFPNEGSEYDADK